MMITLVVMTVVEWSVGSGPSPGLVNSMVDLSSIKKDGTGYQPFERGAFFTSTIEAKKDNDARSAGMHGCVHK